MAFFLAHAAAALGIPAKPSYFTQRVDHFSTSAATYQQRFYLNETVFGGAGHPILFIIGGEGTVPPTTGFFYPFIVDILAPKFKALVVEPEHRFYGTSLPDYNVSALQLLTPQQALADAATLILAMQKRYNCGAHGTPTYCPVITIGGSYPGWLSAMMRLRYPGVVDGAYAASARSWRDAQSSISRWISRCGRFWLIAAVIESMNSALATNRGRADAIAPHRASVSVTAPHWAS